MKLFSFSTLLILGLMFLRRSAGFLIPTLYYEDGATFLAQQLHVEGFSLLGVPFVHGSTGDAYSLFLTRLITLIVANLPLKFTPYLMGGIGFLIVALASSVFSLPYFRFLVSNDILRIIFCVLVGTVLDGGEFFGSTTNFFWPLSIPLILLLLSPKFPFDNLYSAILIFISALSTPLSGILFPFVLLRLLFDKRNRWSLSYISLCLGGIFQVVITKFASIDMGYASHFSIPEIRTLLFALHTGLNYHVIIPTFFGYESSKAVMFYSHSHFLQAGDLLFICILLLLIIGLANLYQRDKRRFYYSLGILFFVVFSFSVPFIKRNLWPYFNNPGPDFYWDSPRYFFIPRACLSLAFLIIIDTLLLKRFFKSVFATLTFLPGFVFGFELLEPPALNRLDWNLHYPDITEWRSSVGKGNTPQALIPIFSYPTWTINLPPNSLAQGSKWFWGEVIKADNDPILLNSRAPLTWKEMIIPNENDYLINLKAQYFCESPTAVELLMRIQDTFGKSYEQRTKFKKCLRKKDISFVLPGYHRRAIKVSFEYIVPEGTQITGQSEIVLTESNAVKLDKISSP